MGRIYTYIYSTLFWAYLILFFTLVPLFAFPFSLIFGIKRSFRYFFKFFVKYGLIILGSFPVVEGFENIPGGRNVILVSNHPSFLDPFLLNACLPGFYNFIVFARLLDNPYSMVLIRSVRLVVRRYGNALSGSSAIARTVKAINSGDSFILFPSGRSVLEGRIDKIGQSLYKIIEETNAVILPVSIKQEKRFTFIQKPFRAKVAIGKPLDRQHILYDKDAAIRQAIEALGTTP
jgi:1-acyl-sn-glycerol-3-phosphate acyltransferase